MKKQTKPIQKAACFILLGCISTLPIFLYACNTGHREKERTVSAGDVLQGDVSGGNADALPKEESVVMPDLVGLSMDEAAAVLTEAGLLYEINWAEDKGKEGMVILSQGTEAGAELPYKAWVTLTANGMEAPEAPEEMAYDNQSQVPFVSGKELQDAVSAISEAGLEIGSIENVYDWDEAVFQAGQVFQTAPSPGEWAEAGEKVHLSVCGPRLEDLK